MTANVFLLLLGLVLLYYGSEWLVRGSAILAFSFSIRPVIVGITVVAFATSAPELLVSLLAAAKGSAGVSVGNILGSNVINIALVVGASAIVKPLVVNKSMLLREIPYMIAASGLFWLLCLDGSIGRTDGLILLGVLAIFLLYGVLTARDVNMRNEDSPKLSPKRFILYLGLILVGLTCLALGADLVVKSAIFIARRFGFSEVFIGLSIVALGTSLPELATSVVAVSKDQSDISIGNVVGSNVFNICLVMGTVGLLNPIAIDTRLNRFEFPFMLLVAVLLFVFARLDFKVKRSQGLIFVLGFFFYVGFSYWMAQH